MSDWSAWAWLGFGVVAIVVLAVVAFVLTAIWSGAREAAARQRTQGVCPRCGHHIDKPWPEPGTVPDVPDDASGAAS